MHTGLKKQYELALKSAAEKGPRGWPQLKAELVADGLGQETLERNREEILIMFLQCLESQRQPIATSMNTKSSPDSTSGSSSFVSNNLDLNRSQKYTQFRPSSRSTQSQAATSLEQKPVEGWIDLSGGKGNREKVDLSFIFNLKTENIIGQHIIERYEKQLLPQVQDDEVTLCCCIDPMPRTYVLKFRIEKSEFFDICLGVCWNKSERSSRDPSSIKQRRMDASERNPRGSNLQIATETSGARASTPVVLLETPDPLPAFMAKVLLEMKVQTSQMSLATKPSRRKPKDRFFVSDTDVEPRASNRQPIRARRRAHPNGDSYSDNPTSTMDD
ncbi:uncharacterized protein RSE6_14086 [Rhynchosporium secalis]|uniref:Uncharacterized protein n=1 Tax=Rhynchosporium secalis TaxID=38038 RepID=A0A1E1MV60_RHYSE|nr:uncharacterized protein RSE6_14086 [Rhynchosporium secalis]